MALSISLERRIIHVVDYVINVAKRKKLPYGTRFNYIIRKYEEGVGHKQLMSQLLTLIVE